MLEDYISGVSPAMQGGQWIITPNIHKIPYFFAGYVLRYFLTSLFLDVFQGYLGSAILDSHFAQWQLLHPRILLMWPCHFRNRLSYLSSPSTSIADDFKSTLKTAILQIFGYARNDPSGHTNPILRPNNNSMAWHGNSYKMGGCRSLVVPCTGYF